MAKKLDDFKFTGRAARSKYQWELWLDGSLWELTQGEDYSLSGESFVASARTAASKMGGRLRASVNHDEGTVVIQFYRD